MYLSPDAQYAPLQNHGRRGVALITVLSMVVIVSLILVAFVTAMRLERTASQSYSQSMAAEQIARGALGLVVAGLQNEMSKDALPNLDYPGKPVYTNVASTNIMPQAVGTNSVMPNLLKISTTTPAFSGSLSSGQLLASSVSTTAPANNGRYVDTNRWNMPRLGNFPNNASTPNWIIMTRGGFTNAGIFGSSGATLNNPATGNASFAIGRFAYAVYDVGGLLDITVAGYPSGLTAEQIQKIKGTLAGALVNQTNFNVTQDGLLQWRNAASGANANAYLGYVTNFLATNAAGTVFPGDNTFISRQDLIKAAKDGIAGLSTNALPNLTTFSRDRNAPSWGPTFNALDLGGTNAAAFAYKSNALSANATNLAFVSARIPTAGTLTGYRSDGTSYSYSSEAGDPVVRRRFPLGRLAWIGPSGPQNGGTAQSIQACFGLAWGPADDTSLSGANVWRYVGPAGNTEQSSIKTLAEVAAESPLREPNFFELLQAGILTGSLGVTTLADNSISNSGPFPSRHQNSTAFQIFRIGANMVDQYDTDSIPTAIEYDPPTDVASERFLAVGEEDLPVVAMFTSVLGAPAGSQTVPAVAPADAQSKAAVYLMFGLWNPLRTENAGSSVPEVRLRVKGGVAVYHYFGSDGMPGTYIGGSGASEQGYDVLLDSAIPLSTVAGLGVNAFRNGAAPLTINDVNAAPPLYQNAPSATGPSYADGGQWERTHPLGGSTVATNLVGLRLPDIEFNLGTDHHDVSPTSSTHTDSNFVYGYGAPNPAGPATTPALGSPFNVVMEYRTASGWVPYHHAVGINSPYTWLRGTQIVRLPSLSLAPDARYQGSTPTSFYFPSYVQPLSEEVLPRVGTVNGTTQQVGMFAQANYYGPSETPPGPGAVRLAAPAWERSTLFLNTDPQSSRLKSWAFYRPFSSGSADPANLAVVSAANSPTLWKSPADSGFSLGFGGLNSTPTYNLGGAPFAGTRLAPASSSRLFAAQIARNNNDAGFQTTQSAANTVGTVTTSYVDRDGLLRIGDSGIYTGVSPASGNPYAAQDSRRVILNRPFRSVAELGYVFRDSPWRTLDFFTRKSGDAGLLDLFTIAESENDIVVGKVNLNARNSTLFSALLDGSVADVMSGGTIGQPSNIAGELTQFTGTNALVNKSQLADSFGPTLSASSFSNATEQNIKARREAFVRALADVGQTRTWNLMVDVIAQSGKFPAAAQNTGQFVVEGERRFWLHVALDRFTGEILDEKLEVVME